MTSPHQRLASPFESPAVQHLLLVVAVLSAFWMSWQAYRGRSDRRPPLPSSAPVLQVDVNEADVRELSLLPRVGPTLARRIVAERALNGPYRSLQDLRRVRGIGDKSIAGFRDLCYVSHSAVGKTADTAEVAATR